MFSKKTQTYLHFLDFFMWEDVNLSVQSLSRVLSHEPQHARPPCPSPTPGVHPNPCPLSQWCHCLYFTAMNESQLVEYPSQFLSLDTWRHCSVVIQNWVFLEQCLIWVWIFISFRLAFSIRCWSNSFMIFLQMFSILFLFQRDTI